VELESFDQSLLFRAGELRGLLEDALYSAPDAKIRAIFGAAMLVSRVVRKIVRGFDGF
jgi:hypothetical protein